MRPKFGYEVQVPEKFLLHNQTLWLSPERCLYWEEQNALIVSDLHLGKTGHFRKSGIAIPQNLYKEDLQRLLNQIQFHKPEKLIVVGDLFHSVANKELELFEKWRNDFQYLHIELVKGNHDILKKDWYSAANIAVTTNHLLIGNFCFVHDISEACDSSEGVDYYFSGHTHPCISLKGAGRQELKFPCFYFNKRFAILPAFGKFTGTSLIEKKAGDVVYAIIPANHARGESGAVIKI